MAENDETGRQGQYTQAMALEIGPSSVPLYFIDLVLWRDELRTETRRCYVYPSLTSFMTLP